MYLEPESPATVLYDESGGMRAGTLNKLVQALTSPTNPGKISQTLSQLCFRPRFHERLFNDVHFLLYPTEAT